MKHPQDAESIDFHHWDYELDVGVRLCRECHESIHDGLRARDQTEMAPEGETWKVDAGLNLINTHEHIHGVADSWDDVFERYNIPNNEGYDWIRDIELPT